jgi:hypothetical protein
MRCFTAWTEATPQGCGHAGSLEYWVYVPLEDGPTIGPAVVDAVQAHRLSELWNTPGA